MSENLYNMKKLVFETVVKISRDELARYTILSLMCALCLLSLYSIFLSIALFCVFLLGCSTALLLLKHKNQLDAYFKKCKEKLGYREYTNDLAKECEVCGSMNCERSGDAHSPVREPWKGIHVDAALDTALDNFYSKIINVFVSSWFAPLSNDEDFLYFLRQNLREATCRLILKLQTLDIPVLITRKLLPMFFAHFEKINDMLVKDKVPIEKVVGQFLRHEYPVHPATINRQAEIEYLKKVVKSLIPRLFTNENFKSRVFFELIVEIFTFWTMLPLMDVISDPNLYNLLVVHATDKTQKRQKYMAKETVVFLERFLKRGTVDVGEQSIEKHLDLLTDQIKLYSFMQFLKKEGAVDILRFYLDVDNLNNELLDPKITTDPSKLSTLHQQSEKLLALFHQNLHDEKNVPIESLSDALENVKANLQGKWKNAYYRTSNYFELIYGSREIQDINVLKPIDLTIGPVTKIGNRLKGALKTPSTLDGEPISIEAIEIPTVWECLIDNQLQAGNNIYNSVTSKLRREKGQSLDAFMTAFMHSVEQCPEIGEDVMDMKIEKVKLAYNIPGNNTVFGNLFDIRRGSKLYSNNLEAATGELHIRMAPSQCLIYILVNIMRAPKVLTRLVLAFCSISQKTIDSLINNLLQKLLLAGLYQPRLAKLVSLLESHLFGDKQPSPTAQELFVRQQTARNRLKEVHHSLTGVFDVLQYPALNKHLMYSLVDVVLSEIYPEFEN